MSSIIATPTTETDHTAAAQAAAEPSKKKQNYRLPKLVFAWARPFRRPLLAVAALMLASSIAGMLVPYTFAVVIDGVQSGWPIRKILLLGVSMTVLTLVARSVFESWRAVISIRRLETVMLWDFRKRAIESVCRLSVGQVSNESSGFRQSILSRGIHAAEQLVVITLHDFWPMVGQVLVISVALFLTTPAWLAFLTFAIGAAQVAYRVYVNAGYVPALAKLSKDETRLDKRLSEFLRHVGMTLLNSQAGRIIEQQDESRQEFMGREIKFWVTHVWRMFFTDVVAIIGRCALFGFAAWLAVEGKMTAGIFLVYVTWSGQLLAALDRFGQLVRMYSRNLPYVNRLDAMLAMEPAVRLPADPYWPEADIGGAIEFRDVFFTYPAGKTFEEQEDGGDVPAAPKEAISGVSFSVRPGERVALVGKSGAGKSTIAHLLARAYDPDSGAVLIDGVDLRRYDLERLRSRIGHVEQSVILFDGSVAENIALAVGGQLSQVPNLELVLQQSRVVDFVGDLGKQGLDAQIGERGVKLSGGQCQRLAIARALAKRPKIIVFDEATASLDAENERLVYEAVFGEGLNGITAIIIAHNLRTIRRADRIVFFERGKVLATGTHAELMESCAEYRTLVEMHEYED